MKMVKLEVPVPEKAYNDAGSKNVSGNTTYEPF
jgi:hypothetical protein